MKWVWRTVGTLVAVVASLAAMLFLYPRPADTTEARVFEGDGAALDYCALPALNGRGARAADIPKAYTPRTCSWQRWPMPVLANCTEPLAAGVVDMRGLWRSVAPHDRHIERIEQCGNRTVVTSAGIIHDFFTDGTLVNGSRDVEPPSCMNTWVAIEWRDGVLSFRPFGLPFVAVTRELRGEELIWHYPSASEFRMRRICRVPE